MLEMAGDYEVRENLDNYWRTLDDDDRDWSSGEEINCRALLQMKCMANDSFKNCKNNIKGRSHLANIHCYNILRHPRYA